MRIIVLVAGKAVGGGTLEDIIDVTGRAQHGRMRAGQFEGRQIVVKRGSGPGLGAVTGGAVLPKLTIVAIDGLVAGKAVGWGTLIDLVDMTGLTGNAGMGSSQLEN